ncbi:IclR family transcriptional regulator [Streptomyces sp. NPDC005811]|uniref:IclR family transcriptional regulator n=1 Tax=Streptomyces sp. NPDC005811 TaxID=3154565 RepID=UPI00340FFEA0
MTDASSPTELTNKSVTKAVRLLRELAAQPRSGATVSALAKAAEISRPTAFRLLNSLERNGFVDRVDHNYILGWELARLGRLADPYAGLVARVQPLLQELADKCNETVTLSVPNLQDGIDLIAEAAGSQLIGLSAQNMIGQRWPLHASSTGKILLAEMPAEKVKALLPEKLESYASNTITDRAALLKELQQVREQGFSVIDNELEEGLLSLSRPIRDSSGVLVAVMSLNGPRYRFGRVRIPEALQQMQATVDRIVEVFWQDSAGDD